MPNLFALAAPAALLAPLVGFGGAEATSVPLSDANAKQQEASASPAAKAQEASKPLHQLHQHAIWRQSLIEQRIIIRISPQRTTNGNDLLNRLPRQSLNARYVERKMDKCLAVESIAGVQTGSGNRLLLFLRNKKIITLNLEKACRARDFYSGFYVEKKKDGKLCVKRDRLHSRNGAKCEVERMRQLVAVTK